MRRKNLFIVLALLGTASPSFAFLTTFTKQKTGQNQFFLSQSASKIAGCSEFLSQFFKPLRRSSFDFAAVTPRDLTTVSLFSNALSVAGVPTKTANTVAEKAQPLLSSPWYRELERRFIRNISKPSLILFMDSAYIPGQYAGFATHCRPPTIAATLTNQTDEAFLREKKTSFTDFNFKAIAHSSLYSVVVMPTFRLTKPSHFYRAARPGSIFYNHLYWLTIQLHEMVHNADHYFYSNWISSNLFLIKNGLTPDFLFTLFGQLVQEDSSLKVAMHRGFENLFYESRAWYFGQVISHLMLTEPQFSPLRLLNRTGEVNKLFKDSLKKHKYPQSIMDAFVQLRMNPILGPLFQNDNLITIGLKLGHLMQDTISEVAQLKKDRSGKILFRHR